MYEFAGGDSAFLALATAHHERCLADPVLNHPFSHPGHPQHVERLATYWAEVFGGPATFSERCSDQSSVLAIHSGNGAEDSMGPRFVACFVAAADDAGLPDDLEFRRGLREYMEWATADFMSYALPGSVVPGRATVPRWSWDGLQSD